MDASRLSRFLSIFPKPKASKKCMSVITLSTSVRQLLQLLGVTATNDDIIEQEYGDKTLHHFPDALFPFLSA